MRESTWARAWADTDSFRTHTIWFWGVEVFGAGAFAVLGGMIGLWLTPARASNFQQGLYPTLGSFIGVITGLPCTFICIYLWNLFRAPYRQRDELRLYSDEVIDIRYGRGIMLCRETQNNQELHRVMIGIRGHKAVDNLEVYPFGLWRITKSRETQLPIKESRLTPMVDRIVNPGFGTYYVDVFTRTIGDPSITFCYRDIPRERITFTPGKYLVQIGARGSQGERGYRGLVIRIGRNGAFAVDTAPAVRPTR